jgi:hypothetical protein
VYVDGSFEDGASARIFMKVWVSLFSTARPTVVIAPERRTADSVIPARRIHFVIVVRRMSAAEKLYTFRVQRFLDASFDKNVAYHIRNVLVFATGEVSTTMQQDGKGTAGLTGINGQSISLFPARSFLPAVWRSIFAEPACRFKIQSGDVLFLVNQPVRISLRPRILPLLKVQTAVSAEGRSGDKCAPWPPR